MTKSKYILAVFSIIVFVLVSSQVVLSAPPVPKTLKGTIYYDGGIGAQDGTPIFIINYNTSEEFETIVSAPPVPALAGAYSTSISGSIGDIVIVRAYNSTHYGESNATLVGGTTTADVTMNLSRYSEMNLTIISPINNSQYVPNSVFNLTFNASVLGANGVDCNITLNISDESIVSNASGTNKTVSLGSINLGEYKSSFFELDAKVTGAVNISISGVCSNSYINFQGLDTYTVYNITVQDIQAPNIFIVSPQNNSINKSNNTQTFAFNVSDASTIVRCDLNINENYNQTMTFVPKDSTQIFTEYLTNGAYNWSINCTDEFGNINDSGIYYLNLSIYYPYITSFEPIQNIVLNAGGSKFVDCNFTIFDGNGAGDISGANATLHIANQTGEGPDNNNYRYNNNTCLQTGSFENESNYTCSFNVDYYAINGSWSCNATSYDVQGLNHNNFTNFSIDPLFAINLSALILAYGDVPAGSESSEEPLSITNVGNMNVNISVKGYGGDNEAIGAGYSMMCSSGENMSIGSQRYSTTPLIPYSSKIQLSSSNIDLATTINKQTVPFVPQSDATYWQLYVEPVDLGLCNGTIVFTATQT